MHLHGLSVEALREIVSKVYTADIARLWMTGSQTLQIKLGRQGGVEKIELELSPPGSTATWPSFLAYFPLLRVLSLTDPWKSRSNALSASALQTVPQTVHTLHLHMRKALSAFVGVAQRHPTYFNNISTLSLPGTRRIHLPSLRALPWPANLTSLDVGAIWDLDLEVSDVPPSLTAFTGEFRSFKTLSSATESFPASLLALDICTMGKVPIDLFKHVERIPNLHRLRINYSSNPEVHYGSVEPQASDLLPLLPRSLEHLAIQLSSSISAETCSLLPPSLKTMYGVLSFAKEPLRHLKHLPRTLERIPFSIDLSSLEDAVNQMGFNERGSIVRELRVDADGAEEIRLPSSLVFLETIEFSAIHDVTSRVLHLDTFQYLTSLRLNHPRGLGSAENWMALPRSLTLLSAFAWGEDHTGAAFEPDSASYLPPSLVTLELAPLFIDSITWVSRLPTTITDLNLRIFPPNTNQFEIPQDGDVPFPRSLTKLAIEFELEPANNSLPHLLPMLPQRLRSLSLWLIQFGDPGFTNEHMKQLPRGLCTLVLPPSQQISVDCAPDLPKALSTFRLFHFIPHWFPLV